MVLQIKWTEIAVEDYKLIVDYLLEEWSFEVAKNFSQTVEARLKTLSIFPFLGIVSTKNSQIRSIAITKHNRLYYRISQEYIEVLNIFDTRQNPEKNKYK